MLHKIKSIVTDIDDEILGAEHYAKMAAKSKSIDQEAARIYASMAKQELSHAELLCDYARRICRETEGHEHHECAEMILEIQDERSAPWMAKIRLMLDGM